MDKKFKLIFEGNLMGTVPLETVKENLAVLLKKDTMEINRLFAEVPVVIKPSVDSATAARYESAFKKTGAVCRVVEIKKRMHVHKSGLILTNIETVPGTTIIEHFGLVSGSTIRAKHFGRDIMASLKNIVGGELKGYTQLLQESCEEAVNRMANHALQFGANAIINVRFSTSSVTQGAAELYAYGTAVKVE